MAAYPDELPADLPVPVDDGAADHLPGSAVPEIPLPATDGSWVDLAQTSAGQRVVVFGYPRTGRPGQDPLVPDWDAIPGARGCTPEACSFRDLHAEIAATGAVLFGLSTQDTDYQEEAAIRLGLSYPLLSDAELTLTRAMRLPTFTVAGQVLLRRQTLVLSGGAVEHVFYPVFPPDRAAAQVLDWLRTGPA